MEEEELEEIENGGMQPDQVPNSTNDPKKTSNEATLNGQNEQASREEEEVDENALRLDVELLTKALEKFHDVQEARILNELTNQKSKKKSKDSKSTDKARDASREKKKE